VYSKNVETEIEEPQELANAADFSRKKEPTL
jgi:hypothetical protein